MGSMFNKINLHIAAMITAACMATSVQANAPYGGAPLQVLGAAEAPIGYIQFCRDHPAECVSTGASGRRVILTDGVWGELERINREVNAAIVPATDLEQFGVLELWSLPETHGDCEDYVLLKRQRLMEIGWPAEALLITVVRDENGEGHAVLTAATDRGDFILDNQEESIRPWHRTPYAYVKRQSQFDINSWVYLGAPDDAVGVASAR